MRHTFLGHLGAALVVAALGVPLSAAAAAAEVESTFTIRFESAENGALQELESLSMTVSRAWETLAAEREWDTAALGPFAAARRGADYRVKSPLPGEATVTVSIAPDTPLPSEARTAQALARALLDGVLADSESRIRGWRDRQLAAPRAAAAAAELRVANADERAAAHRHLWGDVATEHRMAADRLQEAAADLARTRIDLAVAARRLESARDAAERAAETDDIRRRAEAIERQLEAGQFDDHKVADDMRRTIATLRDALAEAERKSPPLVASRRLAFDLEVEMVGLEARKAALEPELVELRRRVVELVGAAAESRVIESELSAARTTRNNKLETYDELQARLRVASVVVVTPPTPGTPRKR